MEERCWSCPASNAAIRSYVLRCSCTCKEREPKGLGQVLRSFIQPKAWCHTALATHAPKTASAATLRGFFMPRDTWKGKNPWLELLSTDPKPLKNHGLFRVCGIPSNTYSFEVLTTSNPQDSFMPAPLVAISCAKPHFSAQRTSLELDINRRLAGEKSLGDVESPTTEEKIRFRKGERSQESPMAGCDEGRSSFQLV